MAEKKFKMNFNGYDILHKIKVQAVFNKDPEKKKRFFASKGLQRIGDEISGLKSDNDALGILEWQKFELSRESDTTNKITALGTLPQDIKNFKENLQSLEQNYLSGNIYGVNETLSKLVFLGQELLRRKYIAKMFEPENEIRTTGTFEMIIECGAKAIQSIGKAPRLPFNSFRKFNGSKNPNPSLTGIEILSSGAFPNWMDKTNFELKKNTVISAAGFENVLDALFDTPRSRMISKVLKEKKINIFSIAPLLRTMLDLELMRLGQATTPGTFTMLLNSYYYGAMMTDHSTNVSEQVQVIYEEENWKPVYTITGNKSAKVQAKEAAGILLHEYFCFKVLSPVNKDHSRTARIQFSDETDPELVKEFFKELFKISDKGIKKGSKFYKRNKKVHKIISELKLSKTSGRYEAVKKYIDKIRECGIKEMYITAEFIRHYPGLLQYFDNADDTNRILNYARSKSVKLTDGRTVDIIATSNKTIEAAAGAIMSGQGCIKVGLLGLTFEQMYDFIKKVKDGLDSASKRSGNQLLVFIGLVDEPVVSRSKVYTNSKEISALFIDLMRRRKHDILLLDTMHKGKSDKRLVADTNDSKGGHLTFNEIKSLIKKANEFNCDIWTAGSYTEDQVYRASLEPHKFRPGLICLGGAERSFGGIRLDPRDAFESELKKDRKLSAIVQFDSDVKFILSRENKLARDAGHTEGELRRRKRKDAEILKQMRKVYLQVRDKYFNGLSEAAAGNNIKRKNLDILFFDQENIFKKIDKNKYNLLKKLRSEYLKERTAYVNKISDCMYDLFHEEWFKN